MKSVKSVNWSKIERKNLNSCGTILYCIEQFIRIMWTINEIGEMCKLIKTKLRLHSKDGCHIQ